MFINFFEISYILETRKSNISQLTSQKKRKLFQIYSGIFIVKQLNSAKTYEKLNW